MKKLLSVIAFAIIITTGYGQKAYFFELSGNYIFPAEMTFQETMPSAGSTGYSQTMYLTSKETYETFPGFNVQVGQKISISQRIVFESALGLSLLKFRRSIFPIEEDAEFLGGYVRPENPYKLSDKLGLTNILYLTIPVKVSYSIVNSKLNIGAGITASVVTWSKQIKRRYIQFPDIPLEYNDYSSNGINNLFFSGNINLTYNLIRNIDITTTYNHGLSGIYDKSMRPSGDWKSSHISLGIRYDLN